MGLIGSIVGGVASAIGGVAAGKALNKGYQEQQKMYSDRLSEIKAHMNKKYYEDPTQNADNQAAVTQAQNLLNEQTKNAQASSVVTGATNDSVALQKQAAAATVGNMLQQQAAPGAANREGQYQQSQQQVDAFTKYLADSKLGQAQGKANAITGAAGGLSSAASNLPW